MSSSPDLEDQEWEDVPLESTDLTMVASLIAEEQAAQILHEGTQAPEDHNPFPYTQALVPIMVKRPRKVAFSSSDNEYSPALQSHPSNSAVDAVLQNLLTSTSLSNTFTHAKLETNKGLKGKGRMTNQSVQQKDGLQGQPKDMKFEVSQIIILPCGIEASLLCKVFPKHLFVYLDGLPKILYGNFNVMEDCDNQQYLPPLVLCEKNHNHFSPVNGKDFFGGEDIYMSIRGGKQQAHDDNPNTHPKSHPC
ncbi:hypothetical protein BKA82DRAFT_4021102 [Pisolithus tinctorius]|nr:hypothetical protein BKA82DRAFT_4021102 [Pisolithus tinctorius]